MWACLIRDFLENHFEKDCHFLSVSDHKAARSGQGPWLGPLEDMVTDCVFCSKVINCVLYACSYVLIYVIIALSLHL